MEIALGAILGAIVASAATCAAYRSATTKSWLFGSSECDKCKKNIEWYRNLPIVSYILQIGRAKCCGSRIPAIYLGLEILGALLGAAIVYRYLQDPSWLDLIRDAAIAVFALYTIALDAQKQLISITATILITIVALLTISSVASVTGVLLAILVGVAFFGLQYLLTRGKGIGSGDIWLGGAIGAVTGWPLVLVSIGIGYIVGSIHAIGLLIAKKGNRKTRLPLGAYLIVGMLITWMWGGKIIEMLLW